MLPGELQSNDHKKSSHKPVDHQGMEHLSTVGKKYFRLIEFDDEERLALEIRKHFFGLFIIFLTGFFVMIITLAISIVITFGARGSDLVGAQAASYSSVALLIGLLLLILEAVSMLIGVYLYRSNVVFVTNQKIAQVLYQTIFNRKISQLNIGDVQDVTVTQKGLFAHIFNYGTLVIETAGEQQNYTFTYVPDPYQSAKVIIGLHEKNIAKFGN